MHKLWPAPPPKSPTARRRRRRRQCAGWSRGNASSFQRLRLTGHRRPPPTAAQLGTGGPGQGSFLTLPRTSLSPTSSRSAPSKRYPPDGGSAQDLASAQGPGRLLGPSHLSRPGKAAALLSRNGHRNIRRSPGSYTFSACLDVSLPLCEMGVSQEEKEPAQAHSPLRR
jgi:hypothetical protein